VTIKYIDATLRPAPRTVCCSKLLTIRLIVDQSYNRVKKTLRAIYS